MGNVINEISIERMRQTDREGYTDAHDDEHTGGELCKAAACYALGSPEIRNMGGSTVRLWPWSPDDWKPKGARRDLIRAAALIVAEIERMDRITAGKTESQK